MGYPSFTTGEILTAADMNRVGLWKINDFSATSGTTVTCDSVFSSDFASYRVVLSNIRLSAAAFITCQLRTSTTTNTNYLFGRLEIPYNTGTALGRGGSGAGTTSSWDICVGTTTANGAVFDIYNPNLAQQTAYTVTSPDPRTGGSFGTQVGGGIQTDTTQFTGFILTAGATISNINVRVYGYRN